MHQDRNLRQALNNFSRAADSVSGVSGEESFGFQAIAIALAGIGSALTRQGITGALSSAASAMNGYSEGNYQQAQFDLQNFKAHAESVIQRNNQVQSEYRQILESRQYSLSQKQNLLRVLAAREHDEVAMAMLRQNNLHALFDLHSKRIDAMNRFQLQAMSILERMVAAIDKESAEILRAVRYGSMEVMGAMETLGFQIDQGNQRNAH